MKRAAASKAQTLTVAAIEDRQAKYTITLEDSATRGIMRSGHVAAQAGKIQAWIIPDEQRARRMREQFRASFYTTESGHWKRCSKDAFVAKMDAEA